MPRWVLGVIVAVLAGLIGFACGGLLYRTNVKKAKQELNTIKNKFQFQKDNYQRESNAKIARIKDECEVSSKEKTYALKRDIIKIRQMMEVREQEITRLADELEQVSIFTKELIQRYKVKYNELSMSKLSHFLSGKI